jgi:hypothetical protein
MTIDSINCQFELARYYYLDNTLMVRKPVSAL